MTALEMICRYGSEAARMIPDYRKPTFISIDEVVKTKQEQSKTARRIDRPELITEISNLLDYKENFWKND